MTTGILFDKWVEQYAYKDAKLRLKTLKTENGLTKVTWYYQNGKVQCDYFVKNNNPESGLIGLGTEFREDGTKLKEIFISKDSTGYYKEFDLSGTISIEYGLDSGDWGKADSKGCLNYREFYPSGKISLELGLFSSGFKNTEYYESGNKKSEIFKVEGLKIAKRIFYDEAGNDTNMKEICSEIITSYSKAFENKFTTIISGGDPSGRLPVLKTPDDVYYSISHPIGEDVYSMFIKVLDVIKLQFVNATTKDDQKNAAVTFGKVVSKLISSSESETLNINEQLNNLGKKDLKNLENIKRVIGI
jgi:antitoxin component YwqK of YwqJK toxin-antitoxin module